MLVSVRQCAAFMTSLGSRFRELFASQIIIPLVPFAGNMYDTLARAQHLSAGIIFCLS